MADCDLDAEDKPIIKSARLNARWFRYLLGALGEQLDKTPPDPQAIIAIRKSVSASRVLERKIVLLLATRGEQSGRVFSLDNGDFPEIRQATIIFVLDLKSMQVVWKSKKLLGGPADVPTIRGPGIHFVNTSGPPVATYEIDQVISREIPWASRETSPGDDR